MNIPPLPKSWLIHEIMYEEHTGKRDSYGNPIYKEPIVIENVRFDNEAVFSRDATDTKVLANAVVYVDSTNSINAPTKFVEQSKITFKNDAYTLKKIIDCYYPNKDEVHHFELEVI